jgi:uncharacterized membrane protein
MAIPTDSAPKQSIPDHIDQTVQAIARLHADHRQGATGFQRVVERLTRFFSRPRAAGVLALVAVTWLATNAAMSVFRMHAFDPPPYSLLQCAAGLGALFMTVFILITQRREDELSELRQQLGLELAIVSEQKAAKIIELLEELRRDLPTVHNRFDAEAHTLARSTDPEAVLDALRERRADDAPVGEAT